MSDYLAAMLGLDPSQPDQRLAMDLVAEDSALMRNLIRLRKDRGLSQTDVAALLGISQPSVQAFEKRGNDPRLSTIRRYAAAIGARVRHVVEADRGVASEGPGSHDGKTQPDDGPSNRWRADVVMNGGVVNIVFVTDPDDQVEAFLSPPRPADSKRPRPRERARDGRSLEKWVYQ